MAAEHYIAKENLFILDERQKIRLVVERLGLSSVQPFVPEKRIIEYMIPKAEDEPLASMSVRGFVELLGSRTPAPGGGSASALIAAMGAALGAMVGWMTYGKRKFEAEDAVMRRLIPPLHEGMKDLLPLIDRDTRAFDAYLAAVGMPKDTAEEKAARHAAMQDGLKAAVQVPLEVMRTADRCWEPMAEMAAHGNPASRSDLEVGAKALETGIWGAYRNVAINLPGIEDEAFRRATAEEAEALAARAALMRDKVLEAVAARTPERAAAAPSASSPEMDCPAEESLVRTALDGAEASAASSSTCPAARSCGTRRARRPAASSPPPRARSSEQVESRERLRRARGRGAHAVDGPGDQRGDVPGGGRRGLDRRVHRLLADGLDMLADALVYGVALYAVGRRPALKRRAARLCGWLQLALAVGASPRWSAGPSFGSEPEPPADDRRLAPGPGRERHRACVLVAPPPRGRRAHEGDATSAPPTTCSPTSA